MLKYTLRSFVIAMLVVSPVLAEDELSTFNREGFEHTKPTEEKQYFAKKAPLPTESRSYLGISAGAAIGSFKAESTKGAVSDSQKNNPFLYSAGVYGGYGFNWNRLYLGAELSGAYNSLNKDVTNGDVKMTVKQRGTAGLDFMPGYLTQSRDWLFYGRLGVGSSWAKLKFVDNTNVAATDNTSKFLFGLRAGAGFEYFITGDFSLRLEYVYSRYGKLDGGQKTIGGTAYSYALRNLNTHQVNLGLSFSI